MTKRTIGMLSCELRDVGDAELCRTGTADEYGQLDRMLIESADVYVEYHDVMVGWDKVRDEGVYEHRLTKVVARRDEESVAVNLDVDMDDDARQERLARIADGELDEDYEDALDYATESVDDMEMDRVDENDLLEDDISGSVAAKWDLIRDESDGMDEDEHYSATWFPRVALRQPLCRAARNLERAIEHGMKKRELFLALEKLNPLASCEYQAKKAIKAAEHHLKDEVRMHYVRRYKWLRDVNKSKDTIPASQCAQLWALIAQRDFIASKKEEV